MRPAARAALWPALFWAAASFFLQGDYGLNVADEGFVWYGAVRTFHGEIPLRDFQSYNPGRYYWIAAFFGLFGERFMAMRAAMAVFGFLGMWAGLTALCGAFRSRIALWALGFCLAVWMVLPFRQFEYAIILLTFFFTARLIERPTVKRHFTSGVYAGLAHFFQINHGVYAALAIAGAFLFSCSGTGRAGRPKKFLALAGGALAGSLPMLYLCAAETGFFRTYAGFVAGLARQGTNILSPVPWPWTVRWEEIARALPPGLPRLLAWVNGQATGLLFLALPAFYAFGAVRIFFHKRDEARRAAAAVAAWLVGAAYLHHAFSRADVFHLAEAALALTAGLAAWPMLDTGALARRAARTALAATVALGVLSAGLLHGMCYRFFTPKGVVVREAVGPDDVAMLSGEALLLREVRGEIERHVPPDAAMLILPDWPAFYCLLRKTSPLHTIYFLQPASEESQKRDIRALEEGGVHWVLFGEVLRGRPKEAHFRRTHGLLWRYVEERFEEVPAENRYFPFRLFRRKTAAVT